MKRTFRFGTIVALFLLSAAVAFAQYERVSVPLDDSPSRGPANAKVVIVEFLDYQ